MATITTLSNPLYATGDFAPRAMDNNKLPYAIWREIDFAAATTAKGSALAAADIIEAVRVPSGHVVLGAYVTKTSAIVGASALTISTGITGVGATDYTNAWDAVAATVGAATGPSAAPVPRVVNSTDTVDLLLASMTGTLTGGKVRVVVIVQDITVEQRGQIAQPRS